MNRLILEVQAEMLCYFNRDDEDYDQCHDAYTLVNGAKVAARWSCVPCQARQQLKEKDEAPTRVT
jgi:hypothetical protein